MEKAIVRPSEYDSMPSFSLNAVRRRYRSMLIKKINTGEIKLDRVEQCVCGSRGLLTVANKDRFGLPFESLLCNDCGLITTNPKLSADTMKEYYNTIYQPLVTGVIWGKISDKIVEANQGENIADNQGELIFHFVKPFLLADPRPAKLKICEIGCSSGLNLKAIKDLATIEGVQAEIYGTEYEENYAALAAKRGVSIIRGGLEEVLAYGVKYDLIILSHVFEHFPDLSYAQGVIERMLVPNGMIYIEVPGVMNIARMRNDYGNNFTSYLVHAHTFNFNIAALEYVMSIGGYRMLAGDETARGLFIRAGAEKPAVPDRENSTRIMQYLAELERNAQPLKTFSPGRWIKDVLLYIYYRWIQEQVKR